MVNSEKCAAFTQYKRQILAALTVNLITFSHGVGLGWFSPILLQFQSDKSPLESGEISLDEASWIGSLLALGGLIGNFLFGVLVDKIGRKNTLRCIALPHLCFWLTIILGNHVYHWFIARIIAGCSGGGLFLCVPIFVAEIADNKIRGTLGSMLILVFNSGILSGFILGAYLSYSLVPLIFIGAPILYIICVTMLPETPQYLLQNNRISEAEASFKFYKNIDNMSKTENKSFQTAFNELKDNFLKSDSAESHQKLSLSDFWERNARRGFIIGVVLMFVNQYSGCFAFLNYASGIFKEAGSELHPNDSTIIMGFIQLIGSYVSTILIDQCGRKILLIISAFGASLGLLTLGFYIFSDSEFKWIPVASLSFVIFIASIGILNLPFVILAEVLPQKIRSAGSTGCLCLASIIAFSFLKLYSVLLVSIQLYGIMWFCASVCFFGGLFTIFYIPETKGKALPTSDLSKC